MSRRRSVTSGPARYLQAALFTVLLSACSAGAGPSGKASSTTAIRTSHAATATWELNVTPMGQPTVIDGVALQYAISNQRISLIAVDAATGRRLWSTLASPSGYATLSPLAVKDAQGRNLVAYFTPEQSKSALGAYLAVSDPRTGAAVMRTPDSYLFGPPQACPDGRDVCVVGERIGSGSRSSYRLDIDKGTFADTYFNDTYPSIPAQGFDLGDGLWQLDATSIDTYLGPVTKDGIPWRVPTAKAFGGGTTTDSGWIAKKLPKSGIYVASLGGFDAGESPVDFSTWSATAALDASTGKVLWSSRGTWIECGGAIAYWVDDPSQPRILLCKYTGTARDLAGPIDVQVQSVNARTGAVVWKQDVTDTTALASAVGSPGSLDDHTVVIPTKSGPILLDLTSGTTRTADADQTYICGVPATVDTVYPVSSNRGTYGRRSAGIRFTGCDANGKQVTTTPGTAALAAAGQRAGNLVLVAEPNRLAAYPVS